MQIFTRRRTGFLLAALLLCAPFTASATPFTIEDYGGTVGLGTADFKTTAINIISVLLGLLTLTSVVMIIIGGIRWLTSGGDEEKLELAKKTISSAVIGLVIVLLAWAIVTYAIGVVINVSQ